MNKKVQKGLVAAVAATMGASIAAPAVQAATSTLDQMYAEAYNAVTNAKTQKELTAARVLIEKVYPELVKANLKNLGDTLGTMFDAKQTPLMVDAYKAIETAQKSVKQADLNTARALIVDMPAFLANAYSDALDKVQQAIMKNVDELIKKAQASGLQADYDAAKAALDELLTTTNAEVKKFAEDYYKVELAKVVIKAEVQSVVATNPTTLTISGVALNNLKASDVTVEGLTVSSVTSSTDGKTATVKLAGPMLQGDTYKVTVKVGDVSKEFSIEFAYDITKVTLIETTYDDDAANQALKVRINNETVDADYNDLLQLGYDVEFVATDKDGNVANIFATGTNKSTTGLLGNKVALGEYEIEVIVTLENKFVVSDKGMIVVKDIEGLATAVDNALFSNSGNIDQVSTTLIEDEVLTIDGVIGDYAGKNDILIPYGKYTVTSNNPAVLSVADNGTAFELTANAPGTATITIDANGKTKTFTFTVKDNTTLTQRKLNKVSFQSTAMKFFVDGTTPVARTYYVDGIDQYNDGNAIAFDDLEFVIPVDGNNDPLVTVTPEKSAGTAAATGDTVAALEVTPAKVGKGTVIVKHATTGKELGRFTVDNVNNDATPYTTDVWFDAYSESRDFNLSATKSTDNELTVNMVQLTNAGYHKGNLTEGTGAGNYVVKVANTDVVKVDTTADDKLTFTAVDAGSSEVLITDAITGKTIKRFTINVTASSATTTGVNWKANTTVTATGEAITAEDVLDVRADGSNDSIVYGVEHTYATGAKVRLDDKSNTDATFATGITSNQGNSVAVYIDVDGNGAYSTGDKYLGTLTAQQLTGFSLAGAPGLTAATPVAVVGSSAYSTANKDKGTILFKLVNEISKKTISSSTITIDVK